MANNPEPTWRASAGGPRRPDKKYGWKPPEPEGTTAGLKRPVKLFALAVGGIAVVGGIVWLILLLLQPYRPGLITLAADPRQAADQLDAPYDPYGWRSAKQLLAWAKANEGNTKSPKVLADDPEWADNWDVWADKLRAEKVDPVVVYVGLHGGVGPDGKPILYTGRNPRANDGPATVSLLDLIDKLNAVSDKRKVLVLDTARGLPDPHLGEVSHDFLRAVKADDVQRKIKESANLVVIVGADEGQRGWESADLGMTALAYQLMKGLSGAAAPKDFRAFTADDLYRYVRQGVAEWAKNNRPTVQEPVIFPNPTEDNRATAGYDQRKFLVGDGGPPLTDFAAPGPGSVPDAAKSQWSRCADLARRSPGPATYTPLAWRRYRELLLRYEEAAMAGDNDGLGVLGSALDRTVERIEAGLRLDVASAGWTLTLPAAAGNPAPDPLAELLWKLTEATGPADLRAAADQVGGAARGRPQRPTEAQFLLMADYFYSKVLTPPESAPPDVWKAAARARLVAELAATGARKDDRRFPYGEQVWPLVRKTVIEADVGRRQAEDAMFAGAGGPRDYQAVARDGFTAARQKYDDALAAVAGVQDGLRVRDELFADLPFLGRWVAEADSSTTFAAADAHKRAGELWVDGHQLSGRLDGLVAKATLPTAAERASLARDAAALAAGLKALKDKFAEQAGGIGTTTIQSQLQSIQGLLLVPVPVIDPEKRVQLVEARRKIEKNLHDGSTPMGSEPKQVASDKPRRRAEAALKALGDPEWEAKVKRDIPQHNLAVALIGLLNDKTGLDATTAAATALAANGKAVAEAAVPPPDKPDLRVTGERFSRVAVALTDPTGVEPAVVNRKARWRALLDGQAARTARDHWYDEAGGKMFETVATAFQADAKALADQIGERDTAASADAREADDLKKVPGLKLAADVPGGQPVDGNIRWTTEPAREVRLALTGGTPPLAGAAVLWAGSEDRDWLAAGGGVRQPFELPRGADPAAVPPVRVQTGKNFDAASPKTSYVSVSAAGFFRGQRVGSAVRFAINNRPDLVVTETKTEAGAMLALRAGDDFDPGTIAFVLDFSGSMREFTSGQLATDGYHKNPGSKMYLALAALDKVLPSIPDRTTVKVRIFSHENPGKQEYDELIFPGRAFASDQFNRQRAAEIMRELRGFTPYHDTPLVKTMRKALQEDLTGTDQVKTMVVLTDGLDTSFGDVSKAASAEERTRIVRQVQAGVRELRDSARDKNVGIHMVFFALGKDKDAVDEMFKELNEGDSARASASRVWKADDAEALRNRLDKILRPKPRLLHKGGRLVEEVPAFGMPVNRVGDGPGELWWYGPRKIDTAVNDTYDLEFARSPIELKVTAGDRMVVRLASAPGRRVTFTREVYYKDVDQRTPGRRVNDDNADWFLSVPHYDYARPGNTHYLAVTAALEAKTRPLAGDEGILKQPRPRFLWWELTRLAGSAEQISDGTVYVRNVARNQLPAPAWRVIANDGPTANNQTSRNRLRAFVAKDRDPDPIATLDVSAPAQLAGIPRPFQVRGELNVTVGLEEIAFYPDPEIDPIHNQPGVKNLCLVVRATDARGRVIQARVRGLTTQEHRYFYLKDGKQPPGARPQVAGYTALFPVSREYVAGLDALTVELVSVTDAMIDPRVAQLPLELDSPSSGQRQPQVIEPGQTADLGLR